MHTIFQSVHSKCRGWISLPNSLKTAHVKGKCEHSTVKSEKVLIGAKCYQTTRNEEYSSAIRENEDYMILLRKVGISGDIFLLIIHY